MWCGRGAAQRHGAHHGPARCPARCVSHLLLWHPHCHTHPRRHLLVDANVLHAHTTGTSVRLATAATHRQPTSAAAAGSASGWCGGAALASREGGGGVGCRKCVSYFVDAHIHEAPVGARALHHHTLPVLGHFVGPHVVWRVQRVQQPGKPQITVPRDKNAAQVPVQRRGRRESACLQAASRSRL